WAAPGGGPRGAQRRGPGTLAVGGPPLLGHANAPPGAPPNPHRFLAGPAAIPEPRPSHAAPASAPKPGSPSVPPLACITCSMPRTDGNTASRRPRYREKAKNASGG